MIQYILEVIAFQLVFLLGYDGLLKRETFFQWNRAYLLVTFVSAWFLPVIEIEALRTQLAQPLTVPSYIFLNLEVMPLSQAEVSPSFWEQIALWEWGYFFIAMGMLFWFLLKFSRILRLRAGGEKRYFPEFTRVMVQKSTLAFSFFKTIFLGENIPKSKVSQILAHELVHVRQWHSLDLLFFELMRIVFWCNPLVYSYQKRLAELHEFIADADVAKANKKEQYQALLAEAFQTQHLSFVNQFFKSSLIKKRIVMLSKNKSKKVYRLKYLLLLPLVLGMLLYVACNVDGKAEPEPIENNLQLKAKDGVVPFAMVDQVPVLPGCENAPDTKACFLEKIQRHVRKNFHYPEEAQELGIQGRVSLVFVVDEQGAITSIRKRGPHELLEKEAVRIIERLPQMQPGQFQGKAVKVPFSIPISFVLQGSGTIKETEKQKSQEESKEGVPFAQIDKAPIFPGCEDVADTKACFIEQIQAHIRKNFHYPEAAQEMGIQGRVSLVFVVDEQGAITNIRKRGPHELLEQEAVRIIERLPQMQPGQYQGKAVKVPFSIPITFKLNTNIKKDVSRTHNLNQEMQINGKLLEESGISFYVGKVLDEASLALPGVSINIKGKDSGVISDFDGSFRIVAQKGDIVQFVYKGYQAVGVTI